MKNLIIFKVYCITFVVTFQCSEISLTSSESKQDETKHQILNVDNHILAISPSKLIIFGFYSMGSELFFGTLHIGNGIYLGPH